jgi:hypothetical protein
MNDEVKEPRKARNVTELVFPRDVGGNLGKMKAATLKAISQMNGNIDKYRALQNTLDLLQEFAETRMRIQMEGRKTAVASLVAARAVANAGIVEETDEEKDARKEGTADQANTTPE